MHGYYISFYYIRAVLLLFWTSAYKVHVSQLLLYPQFSALLSKAGVQRIGG